MSRVNLCVHHVRAALVGLLDLWQACLGVGGARRPPPSHWSWYGHPDPAPIHTTNVHGKCKQWCSPCSCPCWGDKNNGATSTSVPQQFWKFICCLADALVLEKSASFDYSYHQPLNPPSHSFSPVPTAGGSGSSAISLPPAGLVWGWGSLHYHISVSSAIFYVVFLSHIMHKVLT